MKTAKSSEHFLTLKISEIPTNSGIYKFFDEKDQILYVGKAKNLRKRIISYSKENRLSPRIARMVFLARKIEFTQTENELAALLLEHNLIKKLQPKFNILLRDDKTFAQIAITNHRFPRIIKYRDHLKYREELEEKKSDKKNITDAFGPFASNFDVNRTIEVLRKTFLLRNCSDSEFKVRTKACLEYQIKKCSAPCVNLISENDYNNSIKNAVDFLKGKSAEIQKELSKKMQDLSLAQNYEKAAEIRDQIKSLNSIQTKQTINLGEEKDFDAISIVQKNNQICVYISFYRGGQNFGSYPYFFNDEEKKDLAEFLQDFFGQFYLSQPAPTLILVNLELKEKRLIEEFLEKINSQKNITKKVKILTPKKGDKFLLINSQEKIAFENLERKISQKINNQEIFLEIKKIFNLEKIPQRIEVYDNSHTSTTNAVGAMITAGIDGFIKNGYRKFNLFKDKKFSKKDDTAMLEEVLTRRLSKLSEGIIPDLIIIDGGKGQLSAARRIFENLKIKIPFICMSKGENRNAGEELFHWFEGEDYKSLQLPKHHATLHLLQNLRDEAHRFAIMTHRKRRSKEFIS